MDILQFEESIKELIRKNNGHVTIEQLKKILSSKK